MKIAGIRTFHADGGDRTFDFLKISTTAGVTGWSEYNEDFGGSGITSTIAQLAKLLLDKDPRPIEAHVALMHAHRRTSPGSTTQQAIGTIENALTDIKAKALGIPVYELLGGPIRDRIPLYWSHLGSYRVNPQPMQLAPLRTLKDVSALAHEAELRGFSALKTNVLLLGDQPAVHMPGRAKGQGFPALNVGWPIIEAIRQQLASIRQGAGSDIDIMVDLNFHYKTEGFVRVSRAMEPYDLSWVEIDTRDAKALRYIRDQTAIPIASGELLAGRREYRPFFESGAIDVAIIDVLWNGILEASKIASMADAYEINVAPHNFYSPLSTAIAAHFAAAIPNLRIMEIDLDSVPWYDKLVTKSLEIESGFVQVPDGPGWGTDVDEATVRLHPGRTPV
jgi:galactonate dehydratase